MKIKDIFEYWKKECSKDTYRILLAEYTNMELHPERYHAITMGDKEDFNEDEIKELEKQCLLINLHKQVENGKNVMVTRNLTKDEKKYISSVFGKQAVKRIEDQYKFSEAMVSLFEKERGNDND